MRIREMMKSDLQFIGPMYQRMVEEAKKDPAFVPYPRFVERSLDEFCIFMIELLNKRAAGNLQNWIGIVAIPQGKVVKGFITGEIATRRFQAPQTFLLGEMLFVEPQVRNQGIGNKLIESFCNWGASFGAEAVEAVYVPGTDSHKHFAAAGFRTYTSWGVFADKDWNPLNTFPILETKKEKVA